MREDPGSDTEHGVRCTEADLLLDLRLWQFDFEAREILQIFRMSTASDQKWRASSRVRSTIPPSRADEPLMPVMAVT